MTFPVSHPDSAPRPGPVPVPTPESDSESDPEPERRPAKMSVSADLMLIEVALLRRQVGHLLEDRARRSRIDQARGILMHRYGTTGTTALRTLHRWARIVDMPVDALAEAVVTLTVSDDALPSLPREVAHTVSRLLRRELVATSERSLGTRTLPRRT